MSSSITPNITRIRVESSSLLSYGYCPELRILDVEFHGGKIYRFYMVPISVAEELAQAPSKGAYFNNALREHFPFKELPVEQPDDLSAQLERSLAMRNDRAK